MKVTIQTQISMYFFLWTVHIKTIIVWGIAQKNEYVICNFHMPYARDFIHIRKFYFCVDDMKELTKVLISVHFECKSS
jgi:hypothetical protein